VQPRPVDRPPADRASAEAGDATATDDPRTYDYSHPERECDIVMKGGITSGVIYPHAVCKLAKTYRLVNVGGTSAGAIAAAAAGAAEAGRASGGYVKLAALPDWLATGTNLLSLFQPQQKTARLFSILVASLGQSGKLSRITRALVRGYWLAALSGAAPGIAFIALAVWLAAGIGLALAVTAGAIVAAFGGLIGISFALYRDLFNVPANSFGLCSGFGGPNPPALTPWLADLLDNLAGRPQTGEPLTFGDLDACGVHLELMTTNLTQRRPLRLPWVRPERLFFDPAQFRKLFPERVVAHLEGNPPPAPEDEHEPGEWELLCQLLAPLRPLPDSASLPVVVGARLSLSFPLLLSAMPLWAIDLSRTHNQDSMEAWRRWHNVHPAAAIDEAGAPELRPYAEVCWFSDGGISSNFPIHFFDAPLPLRPTFGINLRAFHPDYPQQTDESKNVYLPAGSGAGLLEWWYRYPEDELGRLKAFGESIVRTMQNHDDEAQMRVPGYRDRVVHVSTSAAEGGMNLNMPAPVITALTARGRAAARSLGARFANPPENPADLSWDSHRWTRYRSSIAAVSHLLNQVSAVYRAEPSPATDRTYEDLANRPLDDSPRAYPFKRAAQRALAEEFTDAVIGAADLAIAASPEDLAEGAPKPEPDIRIVPRV
jgi:predicted acylesterase/phospholipase RssA